MSFKQQAARILPLLVFIVFGGILGRYSETPLAVLCLLVATGAFVFIGMELALYVLLICLPFSFRYIIPQLLEIQTPTEPLLGMLSAVYWIKKIVDYALGKRKRIPTFPFLLPICAFIFVTFLSAVNTPDLFGTLKGAFRASTYIMFSLVIYDVVQNYRSLKRLFIASFPSAAIAVIWTVIVLISHIDEWQWTSAFQNSPFTNYSVYGSFTAIFFLICLSRLLFDNQQYDRVMWIGWFACFGLGLIMCFSRGVWLSVIVAVGFMLMQLGKGVTQKKILFVGAVCLVLLVCLSLPGVYSAVEERISSTVDVNYASNRARLMRWGQAVTMFLESPILGKGYGAFAMLYEEDVSLVGSYVAQFQLGAHSEYLQVMSELGVVGLVVWIWLNFAFLQYGFRAIKRIEDSFYRSIIIGLMAAEISLMVHFVVNNLLNGDAIGVPFWGIYGLLPAVVQIAEREKDITPQELT
ncbi:MAG: O-antigen ligase family protein [Candidatus Poribacteria bacterium]|nr:O-antigen ligase family protein [Candidatus Poribacteria bacterium]